LYNLLVIVWGAFVRHTGSGAGCGSHWPTCNGEVIPRPERIETFIELTHRVTSLIGLLAVIGLVIFARRAFPRGAAPRKAATGALVFTLGSAVIGAGLVLFGLVENNDSPTRAIVLSVHLVNTFFLLGSLALAAHWGAGSPPIRWRRQGALAAAIGLGFLGMALVGMSGAVTSLGDTLFPASSTAEVIRESMSSTAHFLNRLRLLHPLLATSVALYVLLMAGALTYFRPTREVRWWARATVVVLAAQMALGLISVVLRAPTSLALAHLLLGDLLWIAMVLTGAYALGEGVSQDAPEAASQAASARRPEGALMARMRAYVALTKPRVVSLLLFTTIAAMFIAAGGWPGGWLLLWVTVGGYLAAGAANAINMVIDSDIDGRMARTAKRPTVTHVVSPREALLFAVVAGAVSFACLWAAANLLAALLAMAGLAFYVVIYSLLLKRRTWHNIVIGGAAGAFPPLVGWAAVTGSLNPLAWWLFAVIFVWTPVHFWALALLIKDDYREAGIPMLPVVHGERVTVIQIMLYSIITAIVSVVPFVQRELGWIYLAPAFLLNALLVVRAVQLLRQPTDRPRARNLFKYSMVYLALMFVIVALDRASNTI
jgi:protoheme IX farnesyltransferase